MFRGLSVTQKKKTLLALSLVSLFSSLDHKVMPINDPFRPHDCIRLAVSYLVVQVFFCLQIDGKGVD